MNDCKEATPDAWREYESEKAKARKEGLLPEQYEIHIKAVLQRLGL